MKKHIIVILNAFTYLFIFSSICFAGGPPGIPDPTSFSAPTSMMEMGNKIIGTIQVIGTIISVAVLIYIGIRFMLASPSDKANLKGALIPYIIGAVILFSAANLVQIIYDIL